MHDSEVCKYVTRLDCDCFGAGKPTARVVGVDQNTHLPLMFQYTPVDATFQAQGPIMLTSNAMTMPPNGQVTVSAPAVAQARQPANNATMMASQVTSPALTQACQASNNATTMASKVTSQAPAAVSNYVSPLPLTATLCESNVLQTG